MGVAQQQSGQESKQAPKKLKPHLELAAICEMGPFNEVPTVVVPSLICALQNKRKEQTFLESSMT